MKTKLKNNIKTLKDNAVVTLKQNQEINKFKNKKRIDIYKKVLLNNEQKNEIDQMYIKNFGKKIPYTWHRHYTAFTGNFDKNYFPELLYIPCFEHYMNFNKSYCDAIDDKNLLPLIAKSVNVKMPNTIISCSYNLYKDYNNNVISHKECIKILSNFGKCFAKPSINSGSGVGCMLLNIKDGIDTNSNKNVKEIIKLLGDNFVIQECIECHESIKKIYSKSVNTFRIMTYRWKNDILFVPSVMRIGRNGNYLDNAHAGGMFIAIDDDGTLHEKAFTEFKEEYTFHPDSKLKFKGYKISLFTNVLKTAKKMHSILPQIGVINWDFTIDKNGEPVLIEANTLGGGIWIFQMAHGKGPFGDKTEEIIRWIKLIKSTSIKQREKYCFGNTGKGDIK